MYSTILKYVIYPIGEKLLGTRIVSYLREVEQTQWWSPKELRELQNKKLRVLIKHAYEKVPYYRNIFEERGLTDKDIETVDDLCKLPILTKNDIRRNFDELKAKDFNKWRPLANSTSGSTGAPLSYYRTLDAISINWACIYRGWGWGGYKLGDKRITFGGFSLLPEHSKGLVEYYRAWIERNIPLSSVHMDTEKLTSYVNKIRKFKPKFIYGYPSTIYILARFLEEKKIFLIYL